MFKIIRRRAIHLALFVTVAAVPCAASDVGLRTPFGEVIVRNLKIGQTYSLYKLVNLPLRLVNTGDASLDLRIDTILTPPNEVKVGYDAIPSTGWVRVERSSMTLAANREGTTDVIISIPNDKSLLGRRFQADIWSRTVGGRGSYAVGLKSHLLLHIDSTPPTEEELKKKYVDERVADMDFTIMPMDGALGAVPLGRKLDLRREQRTLIKLINPNDRPLNFRVRSIPVWESLITPTDGFEAAYNPQWLTPDAGVVKVAGNSIAETSLTLDIPDEPRNRGKKFLFVVSFDILEQKIPTHVYYRLMVTTAA
ncbi:MAG: hypothetical protein HKL90_11070, partial [Elusimicrobia bacterium]|nr:hypothetical protein [Elusimicrobiota bacterium]